MGIEIRQLRPTLRVRVGVRGYGSLGHNGILAAKWQPKKLQPKHQFVARMPICSPNRELRVSLYASLMCLADCNHSFAEEVISELQIRLSFEDNSKIIFFFVS